MLARHDRVPRMEVFRCRRVQITSNRPQPRQLDGDLITPDRSLRVHIRPRALWLCVPRPADAPDLSVDAATVTQRGARRIERVGGE